MSDNGGFPGSVIQSWDVQFVDENRHIITLAANSLLQGQSQYWVTAIWKDNETLTGWYVNPLDLTGPVGFDVGNGWGVVPDDPIPALDVIGTPVPEPGTLCLLGSAGLAMVGFLRRRL